MRYVKTHKQETRERVLKAAAKQVRESGPSGIVLAAVMAEVGLTHGGFYAHFASKDDFLREVLEQMFADSPARILEGAEERSPREVLSSFVDYYLSQDHRDTVEAGCPLPFFVSDAPHVGEIIRLRISEGIDRMRELVAGHLRNLGCAEPDAVATSCVAEIIGAVMLARAEPFREQSDAVLARSRVSVRIRLGLEQTQ